MKIRINKNIMKKTSNKAVVAFLALVIMITGPIQIINRPAFADEYDDKIANLQKDIESYRAEGARLNSEAATLQSALAQISNQKSAIQAQININQAQYDKLIIQIADTEKKIKDNQDALGKIIADLYVDDNISPIEMLASSKNISEYMDKQEYRNSVRDELKSTIGKVKDLKNTLETQKTEVEKILSDQKSQRDTLATKENEQQTLIDRTKGDEASYQQLISSSQAQIAEAKAIQAALRARSTTTGGYSLVDSGSLGDYPWNSSNCPMWGYLSLGGSNGEGGDGHGYGCRQCASYVAWKIAKVTGIYPSWGNATDFTSMAKGAPFYGVEGSPQPGSIAVLDGNWSNSYGHVAWVETNPYTNSRGQTVIQVSQYNFDYGQGYGMYSVMELSVNFFDHYVKIIK